MATFLENLTERITGGLNAGADAAARTYQKFIGQPTAQVLGGGVRGYFGLDMPAYANQLGQEAYKTGQALGNAPMVGAPAGAVKGAVLGGASLLGMLKLLGAGSKVAPGIKGTQQGAILLHGGAKPISVPDPNLIPNVDYQAVFGPGFYTTNELLTPFKSAVRGNKPGGIISVFNLPDPKYAATLKMSMEPVSAQPEVAAAVQNLITKDDKLRQEIINLAQFRRQGTGQSLDKTITGELVEDALRQLYGRTTAYSKLAEAGIPGRTWQYAAGKPENATLIFTEAYPELKSLGQFTVSPGSEGYKIAEQQLKSLLQQAGQKP